MPNDSQPEMHTIKRKLRSLSATIPYPMKRLCRATPPPLLRCITRRSHDKFSTNFEIPPDASSPTTTPTTTTTPAVVFANANNTSLASQTQIIPAVPQSICLWENCSKKIACLLGEKDGVELLQHLREQHVYPQNTHKRIKFTCMWTPCRVYGQPSRSLAWLEGHVARHTSLRDKPFSCIHEGCNQRFASCEQLQRHVNSHFLSPRKNSPKQQHNDNSRFSPGKGNLHQVNSQQNGGDLVNGCGAHENNSTTSQISRKYVLLHQKSREMLRSRRWNRLIGYRVRRTDFLGYYARQKIRQSLVLQALNLKDAKMLHTAGKVSPGKETKLHESEACAPNSAQCCNISQLKGGFPVVASTAGIVDGCLSSAAKRLLKVPHEIVGSRINTNGSVEYLIKWFSADRALRFPEWVQDSEVASAKIIHSSYMSHAEDSSQAKALSHQ